MLYTVRRPRLLVQEKLHVLLLHRKWKTESRNRKRHPLRVIVEAQQVELADNRLDTAL